MDITLPLGVNSRDKMKYQDTAKTTLLPMSSTKYERTVLPIGEARTFSRHSVIL